MTARPDSSDSPNGDSDAILQRLLQLHPKRIDLSLGRILRLAEKLGNPQNHLPPIVHVAGTNGKGSLIAFLGAVLQAAGYSVSRYTSPHLCRFAERIAFNGDPISEKDLSRHLQTCETANDGQAITFFEITTLAAFLSFAERKSDILLLEVGLGGEYDATNIIPPPVLSVITPISLDHQEFLGDDIKQIAAAKAGIIKPHVPVVALPQSKEAEEIIRRTAHAQSAECKIYGDNFHLDSHEQGDDVIYENDPPFTLPPLSLLGEHQKSNACLATAASKILEDKGFAIDDAARRKAFTQTTWAGRLQNLNHSALQKLLDGWEIYLDGGHNYAAAEILNRQAKAWQDSSALPLYVIFGMQNNKDAQGFLRTLQPYVKKLLAVPIESSENAFLPSELAAFASAATIDAQACDSITQAIETLQNYPVGRVLICGSLYLVGEILNRYS